MTALASLIGQMLQALISLAPLWLAALSASRGAALQQAQAVTEIKDEQMRLALDRPADSAAAVGML